MSAPFSLIVTDTSPLLTLALADALDALLRPRLRVRIPDAVFIECGSHGFKPGRPDELRGAIAEALAVDGPAIVDCVVAADELPNVPHIDLELAKNYAIAKIKEAVIAATGR